MPFKYFISQFMMLSCLVAFSGLTWADNLRCHQDFSKIRSIILKEKSILDRGAFEEVITHSEQFDYDELLKTQHPEQKYLNSQWMSEEQYYAKLKETFDFFHDNRVSFRLNIGVPKQNFQINHQELCIFNVQFVFNAKERDVMDTTYIAVRPIEKQNWRLFSVDEEMSEQDFREFFPNFPKNIAIKELAYTH